MKVLFLIFHGFAPYNGISKKINYQVNALHKCGADTRLCHLKIDEQGNQLRMIDDTILDNYGNGIMGKIKKRTCYKGLTQYILDNKIDLLYIRSAHNANLFINKMVRRLHKTGVKIVLEIPTYPYEGQFKASSRKDKLRLQLDLFSRDTMAKYLDYIVTFTEYPKILGVPTISISNGIDFEATPVKTRTNDTSKTLNLLGVAELHYWHAFDRLIEGLAEYNKAPHDIRIVFNIVGHGAQSEVDKLKGLVAKYSLEDSVIFHGTLSGEALDEAFESSDMGVASLGRHRSGNSNVKTLKNREYAARGIPFVYSETDDDFDTMPYVIKAPADESRVDIASLVEFYKGCKMSPEDIRETIINTLSWKVQMQKVLDTVNSLKR